MVLVICLSLSESYFFIPKNQSEIFLESECSLIIIIKTIKRPSILMTGIKQIIKWDSSVKSDLIWAYLVIITDNI